MAYFDSSMQQQQQAEHPEQQQQAQHIPPYFLLGQQQQQQQHFGSAQAFLDSMVSQDVSGGIFPQLVPQTGGDVSQYLPAFYPQQQHQQFPVPSPVGAYTVEQIENSQLFGLGQEQVRRPSRAYASIEYVSQLMRASCNNNQQEVSNLILNHHVNVDSLDLNNRSALHIAALNGHIGMARNLIEHHANVNIQDNDLNTPLHLASQCGHTRTVEILLTLGCANENLRNVDDKTPYQLAIDFGHGRNKIMKQLFRRQFNADSNNNVNFLARQQQLETTGHNPPTVKPPKKRTGVSKICQSPSFLPSVSMVKTFRQTGVYVPNRTAYVLLTPFFDGDPEESIKFIQTQFKLKTFDQVIEFLRSAEKEFATDPLMQLEKKRRLERSKELSIQQISPDTSRIVEDAQEIDCYRKWRHYNHNMVIDLLYYIDPNFDSKSFANRMNRYCN